MGVTGLWDTVKPSGRSVTLSSLRNKKFGVDVSLWMHNAANGIHERHGIDTADAHLMVVFSRICILLQHGIMPIFVFDGTPPDVKARELEKRRRAQGHTTGADGGSQIPSTFSLSQTLGSGRSMQLGDKSSFAKVVNEIVLPFASSQNGRSLLIKSHASTVAEQDIITKSVPDSIQNTKLKVLASTEISRKVGSQTSNDDGSYWKSRGEVKTSSASRKQEALDYHHPSVPSSLDVATTRQKLRRACRDSAEYDSQAAKEKDGSAYSIHSSVESHTTDISGHVPSDDDIEFISSSVQPSARKLRPSVSESKPDSDDEDIEATVEPIELKKRKKYNRNWSKASVPFPMNRIVKATVASSSIKPTQLFSIFATFRKPAGKTLIFSELVSPEKRRKKDSLLASPAKIRRVDIDLTRGESDSGENDIPIACSDGKLEFGDDETEKTFSAEQLKDDFWKPLLIMSDDADPEVTLENEEVPSSQEELFSASQPAASRSSQATRQKNGVSILPPANMKENFQALMNLFRVPFIEAPGEAEAQCACLELSGVTEGTISDDGDVLLFGGRRVYRNFFKPEGPVEFDMEVITEQLNLDRDKLIDFAQFTGCDYFVGVKGVGSVRALEILAEFGGLGVESLKNLMDWLRIEQRNPDSEDRVTKPKMSKLRKSLLNLDLPVAFPAAEAINAYRHPHVDERVRNFRWGKADVEQLRDFARARFSWDEDKISKSLKFSKSSGKQRRMDEFYPVNAKEPLPLQLSQRVGKAVKKMGQQPVEEGVLVRRGSDKKPSKPRAKRARPKTARLTHHD